MNLPFPVEGRRDTAWFPAHRDYLDRRYFLSLNGLRCLCIASVLWHHAPANGLVNTISVLERGFVGVDFFFVLSGFLITTLLLREEGQTGRISWLDSTGAAPCGSCRPICCWSRRSRPIGSGSRGRGSCWASCPIIMLFWRIS